MPLMAKYKQIEHTMDGLKQYVNLRVQEYESGMLMQE